MSYSAVSLEALRALHRRVQVLLLLHALAVAAARAARLRLR